MLDLGQGTRNKSRCPLNDELHDLHTKTTDMRITDTPNG